MAHEIRRGEMVRCVEAGGKIPAGALCERYSSQIVWSLGRDHGTVMVPRAKEARFESIPEVHMVRSLVYSLKAAESRRKAKA